MKDDEPKIADFGLAKKLTENQLAHSICGTVPYFAPELLKREPYGYKVDLWAMGVLLYKILFNEFPFGNMDTDRTLREMKIKTNPKFYLTEKHRGKVSSDVFDLFSKIFVFDSKSRIDFYELLTHPVFF